MTTDLKMLAWVAGLTLLAWLPYILNRATATTLKRLLNYEADNDAYPAWAARAKRAHYNAIENLAPFAALVLTAHLAGASNAATAASSTVYLWARVVHYIGYVSGFPAIRTLAFTVGWLACICIFWNIIT